MSKDEYESRIIDEYKRCHESFSYFCENYIKINHFRHGLINLKLYPFQQRLIDAYEGNQFVIGTKFRQGGFTTITVIYGLWRCMFYMDQVFNVYGKTDREAIHLGKIAAKAIQNLPDWMQPKMDRNTQHEKKFTETNSQLSFYTLFAAKGRSCTHIYIDEAAYIKDMKEQWMALYPTLACGGRCYVLSTVNGMGNWFEEMYHAAVEKENHFHVYEAHYSEHPDFQNEEYLAKIKGNLGEKAFLIEMESCFLTEWKPTEPPELADQLLAIASKRRLSEEERSALFEAACRLRYETKEVEAKMKVLELEKKKLQTLKYEIEVLELQSNLSSPST
jgi:hypothetical protein